MNIVTPKIGARCFDHYGTATPAQLVALKADGFDVGFIYVELLTPTLLANYLAAELQVGFVMEGLSGSTQPTTMLGSAKAQRASQILRVCQVPKGPTIFADLENDKAAFPASDWIAFANAAGSATLAAGDDPGVYIAEGTGMTRNELSALPGNRYWKGAARVIDRNGVAVDEPGPGWCVLQGIPINLMHSSGVEIDVDVAWQDRLGRSIFVVSA